MARIVILGAGLTGISTAYHLEQKGFFDYALFEKESELGGLCRSIEQDGFTFDYTGHLLHISDPYFRSLIETVVGLDSFYRIERRSFIYSQNTYTKYPYQINLHGLPPTTIVDCIQSFVERPRIKNPRSFKAWVLTNFGEGFGTHFFFPYQGKIFAYDIEKLTASWTQRFVPPTSLEKILHGSLTDQTSEAIGYNAQFLYPKRGGIVSWVATIAQQLKRPIQTDHTVTTIDLRAKKIVFANGHIEPYETLVTTLPLDRLLALIKEPPSSSLKKAQEKLRCNQVINFNLGVQNPSLSDKHWIYFPESHYPFYRIGFPHNFSPHAVPTECSSLYGEIAHCNQSQSWVNDTLKHALAATKKLLGIADHDILTEAIIHIPHAYVIYDAWRDRNVPRILAKLQTHGVHSIGRYGAWKYASMQESILDGKQTAEQLVIIPARSIAQVSSPFYPSPREHHETH